MYLEIEVRAELLRDIRRLAELHYGDSSDDAISQVVEAALEMRLEWLALVEDAGREVEEPVASWETEVGGPGPQAEKEIGGWLFEGRR